MRRNPYDLRLAASLTSGPVMSIGVTLTDRPLLTARAWEFLVSRPWLNNCQDNGRPVTIWVCQTRSN